MNMDFPSINGIRAAESRIRPYVPNTPLINSQVLSKHLDADVWLKIETLTSVASFKIRGALNAMLIAQQQGATKVATSSTGNHGQGIAYAGNLLGIGAHIFMPRPINTTKSRKIGLFGGNIHEHGDDIDEAKDEARAFCEREGGQFLDDGNDVNVMEGAGTVALEVATELQGIDAIIVPLGGGNLSAGCATAMRALQPNAVTIGVQAKGSPAVTESFHAREKQEHATNTIAEGLVTRVPPQLALEVLWERLDDAWLSDDTEILKAVKTLADSAQILVEPAGAAGLAGLWEHREKFRGKRIVLLLTGANLTMEQLSIAMKHETLF